MSRPTSDPKSHLVAVRLAPRHIAVLERLAHDQHVSLSEALRRLLDEYASPRPRPRLPGDASDWQRFAAQALFGTPRRRRRP